MPPQPRADDCRPAIVARRLAPTDYELILLLDPEVDEAGREKLADDAKARLEGGGELTAESDWGMRKMAYEIKKRGEADYRCFRFRGEKALLDDLNHSLRINDGILRFRIFKVDPESPLIVPPDTATVMQRDDDDGRGRGRGGPRRGPREEDGGGDSSERSEPVASGDSE